MCAMSTYTRTVPLCKVYSAFKPHWFLYPSTRQIVNSFIKSLDLNRLSGKPTSLSVLSKCEFSLGVSCFTSPRSVDCMIHGSMHAYKSYVVEPQSKKSRNASKRCSTLLIVTKCIYISHTRRLGYSEHIGVEVLKDFTETRVPHY